MERANSFSEMFSEKIYSPSKIVPSPSPYSFLDKTSTRKKREIQGRGQKQKD
jgi:hypothetical protein